jgi:hypothetical protein
MEIVSGILVWLLVWFLVSIPVSLALAQLLKSASAQLCAESTRPLQIRQTAFLRPGPEVRSLSRKRLPPLGVSPALSR